MGAHFLRDFKKPINSLSSINSNKELWKTIEKIEKTSEGSLLVLSASNIPLGLIDRSKIGYFILNKLVSIYLLRLLVN